jgi:disulfide bond formation protein DsbB
MSGGLLVAAFLFEYVGGLAPCKMCIWQRWAHVALILTALSGLLVPTQIRAKPALMFVVVAAMISAAIAGFHAGVEWQLWDGPSGCTASLNSSGDMSLLVDQLLATPVVRCDEVPWSLFGISMAGWNSILSLDIAGFALMSWLANRQAG